MFQQNVCFPDKNQKYSFNLKCDGNENPGFEMMSSFITSR